MSFDLSIGLFRSTVLFMSFAGVLWTISKDFTFRVGGVDYAIPGFMLWAAHFVRGGRLAAELFRRTQPRRAERRPLRARGGPALRARPRQRARRRHCARGRRGGRARRVEMHLGNVMIAMRRLVRGLTNLTWVTAGFGWITGIAPILVAAPLYFSRQDVVRRHDDGGGRVHAGTGFAALVRRQLQLDRGLARHAPARRELPRRARRDRVAASRRKPDRLRRRRSPAS